MFGLRRQKPVVESGERFDTSTAGGRLPVGDNVQAVVAGAASDAGADRSTESASDALGMSGPAVPWQAITEPAREQEFQHAKCVCTSRLLRRSI